MASVGGVSCTFVRGSSRGLALQVETWTVPGISGVGAMRQGFTDSEFVFSCVLFDSHANVVTWKNNIEALQGSAVTIIDDHGSSHTYCLIEKVGRLQRTAALTPGGGDTRGELLVEGRVVA